jgi:hypothetical protein
MKKAIDQRALPVLESVEGRVLFSSAPSMPFNGYLPMPLLADTATSAGHAKTAHRLTVSAAVPATDNTIDTSGLTGNYFQGADFQHPAFVRTDATIDFNWGDSAPDPSLVGKAFSVRWTGQIHAQYSENYTFYTNADDGVRLWVGGKLVVNDWRDQYATPMQGTVALQAGQTYDIKLEYFENGRPPAAVHLSWSSASQAKQIVPPSAFVESGKDQPTVGTLPPAAGNDPVIPDAPLNLTATAASISQINLQWSDVTGATGFVIERSPDGTTAWTQVGKTGAGQTSFADTGLASNTTYFYRVYATIGAIGSEPSNTASATTAANIVYGFTNAGQLISVNAGNATTTPLGTLAFGTAAGSYDPVTGRFFYIEQNTSTPRVAYWDPATQQNVVFGAISVSGPVMRATVNANGVLFITAGNSDLYTIDTSTGAANYYGTITANGSPLPTPSGDMQFAPDGTLYVDDGGSLYDVNFATLSGTYLGNDGAVGNVQTAFAPDGLLYGADSAGSLYTINLTNGSTTLVGNTGVANIGDLSLSA